MSIFEKTVIKLLCRLFWLITQTPGVARYTSDVVIFSDAELLATDDPTERKSIESTRDSYRKG